jgi:tyrosinase co-factor MelC1
MTELSRRRALAAGAAVAATTAGLQILAGPASAAGRPSPAGAAGHDHGGAAGRGHGGAARRGHGGATGHDHGGLEAFDEVYRGRRIQGRPAMGGHHHGSGYRVFVDGVELHVMPNADGSWISVVSHYDPVPTPHAAARAAVEELQGAPLVPLD